MVNTFVSEVCGDTIALTSIVILEDFDGGVKLGFDHLMRFN